MTTVFTRRQALVAGAAAAAGLPILAQAPGKSAVSADSSSAPPVGISTLGFPEFTNKELAKELAANGIRIVQLFLVQKDSNYWVYNGRNDVSALTGQRCKEIAEAYTSEGVEIHSIGVYTNLVHPDEEERKANLDYFEDMFRVGTAMGVTDFVTEAGHYDPTEAGGVAFHFREKVWNQMVNTGKELVARAERYDATIMFEPYYLGFFASAKRTRLFLESVESPRAKALLDPANLLELNDLDEMFNQLAPHTECFHAKDRKLHVDAGVPAGQGDLDYPAFVALAKAHAPHAPMILEYVGSADYKQALAVLKDAIDANAYATGRHS